VTNKAEAYEHGGAPIHDALAVAHVVRPDLLTLEERPVHIELAGISRGRTVVDVRRRTNLLLANAGWPSTWMPKPFARS
jgi:inosine-uridine nucleoside N-ribohydrolase